MTQTKPHVGIIMGSKSDLPVMEKASEFLTEYGIANDLHVASAHRNPDKVKALVAEFEATSSVIIAAAGMAAHLPGVVAAYTTTTPVIGVPIRSSFDGLDALMSIVQMPPGIPVATVAVNGAKNAAILAMEMIAIHDDSVKESLRKFRATFNA
ncbi:MAG: 5-(carboxyamino)imidazole ribonucleotide mutase [Candidatus Marinamargulisbacteria bacterium]|jgi:5-(carboxyamino)imidazole ribonucleotide mutase|nr:5-(carboxyamino)imidazole ribonucleotide mutase [bacterium]MDG2264759.1 5-(carboxyamino)imidazole ribonucleotide mutase [Candidatus Marinamargulisbacteria bacterium]|tara:strand:+ start:152 stop:610 length:459 start_codon:yes stop_codon:yes gene_type:complete